MMDKIQKKRVFIIVLITLGLASVITAFGFGCGNFKPSNKAEVASTGPGVMEQDPDSTVIPGAKTTSLVYANQVLHNMLSVTRVQTPSPATLDFYEKNKINISEFGSANSLTAPMILAIMGLGTEVCNDLITQERDPSHSRNIFNAVNFSTSPQDIDESTLSDVIRRMARSFWGRNETSEELSMIIDSIHEVIESPTTGLTDPEGAKGMMIYICGGMLTSYRCPTTLSDLIIF